MGYQKLALTMLIVDDFPKMREFYEKTVGLQPTDVDEKGQWAEFGFSGGDATLAIHAGIPVPRPKSQRVVPSILVDDIEATVGELKGKGVEFVQDVHQGAPGIWLADFADPEGNMISLMQIKM